MHKKFIPTVIRNSHNDSIVLNPPTPPKGVIIWLHGLCDTSQGFMSFFVHSHSPLYHNHLQIKLLQAPMKRIAINSNMPCHSWYNIFTLDRFKKNAEEERGVFDFDDIEDSLSIIREEVKRTAEELYNQDKDNAINPYHRIYLGGFSQGGVMALNYALQSENVLGGAIAFSSYALKSFNYKNFRKIPILLAHGKNDQIINQLQALKSYEHLLTDQSLVFYEPFDNLQHSVCLQQLDLMNTWIHDMDQMRKKLYQRSGKIQK